MGVNQLAAGILIAALGVAGCGDDDAGGTGSAFACNVEPDLSRAISIEFPGRFWGCYDAAGMDVEDSVEACVREDPGLSPDCAACYADHAGCVDTACGEECNARGDDTLACSQCVMNACVVDLTSCSGVGFPMVQPQ
jgi:hypothetical protein